MIEEKIKLRISNYIERIIVNDCLAFNFVRGENVPNVSGFMNKLIPNLLELRKHRRTLIHEELSTALDLRVDNRLQERIRTYMDTLFDKIYFDDGELDDLTEAIWIRPRKETLAVFDEIIDSELEICQIDLSSYLRSLLNEYAKLQQHKRELILFSEEMELIKKSIEYDFVINLRYKGQKYSVVMLNYYSEFLYEQNNYILSYDIKNNKIKSMLLSDISKVYILKQKFKLSENVFSTYHKICENYIFNESDTFDIEEA